MIINNDITTFIYYEILNKATNVKMLLKWEGSISNLFGMIVIFSTITFL